MAITFTKPHPVKKRLPRERTGKADARIFSYVSLELEAAVSGHSKQSGMSVAEVIRRALTAYLEAQK